MGFAASMRIFELSKHFPAVVYTVYSVAGVVLVFAAGALIWREPVTYRSALGVLSAVCAIILLNN